MRYAILCCLLTGLADSPAMAVQPLSTVDLYTLCTSSDASMQDVCGAFINGFAQEMGMGGALGKNGVSLCFPDQMSGTEAKLVFIKFVKEFPENLHKGAAGVLGGVLALAYRCPKSN
jgi:hypothetical protein